MTDHIERFQQFVEVSPDVVPFSATLETRALKLSGWARFWMEEGLITRAQSDMLNALAEDLAGIANTRDDDRRAVEYAQWVEKLNTVSLVEVTEAMSVEQYDAMHSELCHALALVDEDVETATVQDSTDIPRRFAILDAKQRVQCAWMSFLRWRGDYGDALDAGNPLPVVPVEVLEIVREVNFYA